MKKKILWFQFILLFQFLNRKSMFAVLHSNSNSQVWPPSFNQPDLLEKSKIELEAKFFGTISLIDTSQMIQFIISPSFIYLFVPFLYPFYCFVFLIFFCVSIFLRVFVELLFSCACIKTVCHIFSPSLFLSLSPFFSFPL